MKLPEFTSVPDAIALDLDGTLFGDGEEISPRNRKALEGCLDMGIPVILATSRPARLFHQIIPDDLIERCSYTVLNGAVIKGNPPLSGYMKSPIPEDLLREVIELSCGHYPDIQILTEIEGFEFGSNQDAKNDKFFEHDPDMFHLIIPIEESIPKQPSKIVIAGTEEEVLDLQDKIIGLKGEVLSIVPALKWRPVLNITNPEATKTNAIRRLLKQVGKSLDNVVAFGDDYPDLDMLQSCGYGVAMGNAFPDIIEACSYNTATNVEDGVAMVLETIPGIR